MPASPTATPEHIKDVNTRYHDAAAHEYDAKWGIDFGDVGQDQVRGEAGQSARRRGRGDLRRRARDRLRDRLLLAQPDAARADRAADRDRHLTRDAGPAGGHGGVRSGWATGSPPSSPRPRRCPSTTRASTWCSATRSSTTSPTSTAPSPSSSGCCGRADGSSSPASPPATATASRRCRSGPGSSSPRPGVGWSAPEARAVAEADQSEGHSLEGEVDVHAFAPADLRRLLERAGFDERRVGGESSSPTPGAGASAPSSRVPNPTPSPSAGAPSPSAATSPCRRSTPGSSSPASPPSSSTTCSSRRVSPRRGAARTERDAAIPATALAGCGRGRDGRVCGERARVRAGSAGSSSRRRRECHRGVRDRSRTPRSGHGSSTVGDLPW